MFKSIALRLNESKFPCLPLFQLSHLPAVPEHQIKYCHQKAFISKWIKQHPDKDTGIVIGYEGSNFLALNAILVHVDYPNVLAEVKLRVPEQSYQFASGEYWVFLFKAPKNNQQKVDRYYLEEYSPKPVVKFLVERQAILIGEEFLIPTKDQIDSLAEYSPRIERDFVEYYNDDKIALTQHSKEDLVYSSTKSLGQFDVSMTRHAVFFAYEVIRNNKPVIPMIYELQALHVNESDGLELTPNYAVEVYINKLFTTILEELLTNNCLLSPNWDKGFGKMLKKKYNCPITKDLVQLPFTKLKEDIFAQLCESFQDEGKMLKTVHNIIEKLGKHTEITKLELDNIKRFVSRQSGLNLHMTKLDSQIQEARRKSLGIDSPESIVDRIVQILMKETRYRYDNSYLWAWNGCYWEIVPDFILLAIYHRFFDTKTTRSINRQLVLTGVKSRLQAKLQKREVSGVNFLNGFVTEQGQLLPHDPDMGLTYVLPFAYAPRDEIPPQFYQFLDQIWGKTEDFEDKVYTLRQAMAVTFFNKSTSYQRAFLLQGVPQSGKTQLLEIIKELTPKHKLGAIPPENWGNISALLTLRTKLLNVCGELSESKPINSQRFKDVIDGGGVDRNLSKKRIDVISTNEKLGIETENEVHNIHAAHWFASNHLPITKDFSQGFSRRWLIFDFPNPVPAHRRRVDIAKKIVASEKEAIICWVISGFSTIVNEADYHLSSSFIRKSNELGQRNNKVKWFIEASGAFVIDPNFASQVEGLSLEEKNHLLNGLPFIESSKLFLRFKQTTGSTLSQGDFQRRMSELASLSGFLSVVCQNLAGGIETRYYGITER